MADRRCPGCCSGPQKRWCLAINFSHRLSVDEINNAINYLKHHKAPGVDQILNEFLTTSATEIGSLYVKIFNLVLNTGIVPDAWIKGIIIPIYKNEG